MKRILCTIGCLLMMTALRAQAVIISDEININNDDAYFLLGKYKDRILLLRDKSDEFIISAFDEKMRSAWNKEIKLDRKNAAILDTRSGKSSFSVIYQYRSRGHIIVKVNRYNPETDLVDSLTVKDYGIRFITPEPEIIFSEDKKLMTLYHFEKANEIEALVFDLENMKLVWEKNIVLSEQLFYGNEELEQIVLNNAGELYLILNKNNDWDRRSPHHFDIYRYNELENAETLRVDMKEYLTYDVEFDYDNTNNFLAAGGLYAEKNRTKARGYYSFTIPHDRPESYRLRFYSFDNDFMASLIGKPNADPKGIADSQVQQIVFRKDGGILIIGEQIKRHEREPSVYMRGYYGRDYSRNTTDYNHDNLYLISLHPDGDFHWKTVLYKKQYSQDNDVVFASYFLVKTSSSLRLLFNDEVKNKTTVLEYAVTSTGETERSNLLSTDNLDLQLRLPDAQQVSSNEVIIPSESHAKLKLIRVVY